MGAAGGASGHILRVFYGEYGRFGSGVIERARYRERLRGVPLNDRQRLIVAKLLEGLEGKLTTSRWAALTKSSADTALRDIQQLVERGVLVKGTAGGRSTSYTLAGLTESR